jgi:hypothetical protein
MHFPGYLRTMRRVCGLVLLQPDIDGFRVTQQRQCKARLAGNGRIFTKRRDAAMALLALEVEWLPRRASVSPRAPTVGAAGRLSPC